MKYTFHAVPREELSRVVSGTPLKTEPRHVSTLSELETLLGEDVVGLLGDPSAGREFSVIVVQDSQVRRFYAWVSTYLPGLSPLSQLVRVITVSELRDVLRRKPNFDARLRQAWVGVVLGECMSRTKDVRSFSSMSLAAAQSAASLAIAKMHSLGALPEEYERAILRLSSIVPRSSTPIGSLSPNELLPIWSALLGHDFEQRRKSKIGTKVQELLSSACVELAVDAKVSNDLLLAMARVFEPLRDLTRFESAPAEVRIRIFDEIVSKLILDVDSGTELAQIQAFAIGYAASRVAIGGLKHVELLNGLGALENTAKIWFCLSCFITSRGGMSDPMVNLSRLIDRELRYEFSIFQVPRHDVSWDEFSMLTEDVGRAGALAELPKASPRSASIEMVPGASLVVSVVSRESTSPTDPVTARARYEDDFVIAKMNELDNAISAIWKIRQAFVGGYIKPEAEEPRERVSSSEKKISKRKKKAPDLNDLF